METNTYEFNKEEMIAKHKQGMSTLFLLLLGMLLSIAIFCYSIYMCAESILVPLGVTLIIVSSLLFVLFTILLCGLKVVNPNEALVLVLFGKYYGTLYESGFYWVNPFCSAVNPLHKGALSVSTSGKEDTTNVNVNPKGKAVSMKTNTLENQKQKVNDELGNPIEIGTIVIWKVSNATKAVFNAENYETYLSIQCDAVTRNVARCYPYDTSEAGEEWSLRGSSQEIAAYMAKELQEKVENAGITIIDVRITHLAYAPEIASAMLQRQQAAAIIDARQKIVEGAVSMVDMALKQLADNDIVELDEERKAAMVSNLLVILCGNKDAQPIVNSGSIY